MSTTEPQFDWREGRRRAWELNLGAQPGSSTWELNLGAQPGSSSSRAGKQPSWGAHGHRALALATTGHAWPPGWPVLLTSLCGMACLGGWVVVMGVFPTGLSLGYPYYDTTVDYGAWVALAAFVCVLAGVACRSTMGSVPAADATPSAGEMTQR